MSEVKVNKISPRTNCGTVQLGDSGDTITIPAGATITNSGTQTGFGRTGTVDWQTGDIKTSTFTAVNAQGFFVDTSSGAVTANLPAGTAGSIIAFADYTNTFDTNSLTITPNGSQKIGGVAANAVLTTQGVSATFLYVDDTEGWKNINDATGNAIGNLFLLASGGTETTSGNCKIHTFTGPGTFTVTSASATADENVVSYLIVAGGASGGSNLGDGTGGGGAGGFREVKSPLTPYTASPLDGYGTPANRITVTAQAYPIVVGAGGAGVSCSAGNAGSNSSFGGITSAGGGKGAQSTPPGVNPTSFDGGSGGGAGGGSGGKSGGAGNTPPVTPSQGNPGGSGGGTSPDRGSGGGGGAAAAGTSSPNSTTAGNGGNGVATSITGSEVTRAGGGGANISHPGHTDPGNAGSGGATAGGGAGASCNASANTGSGSGGASNSNPGSGNGGSGIVVIRYKFQ
jgi:hypothetical protein